MKKTEKLDRNRTRELVSEAQEKQEKMKLERGFIQDADTILMDCLENQDESEVSGIFDKLIELYEKAADKDDFAKLFELLAGVSFETYLARVVTQSGPVRL